MTIGNEIEEFFRNEGMRRQEDLKGGIALARAVMLQAFLSGDKAAAEYFREKLENLEKERIAEIDRMFEAATSWGSWMVSASNERKGLVNRLREAGHQIEHRYETDAS